MPKTEQVETLTIVRPDDWHVHLRDGAGMADAVAHTARTFARAIVMPNLMPAVTTTAAALAYRARILAALPENTAFSPLMTLYLTDSTSPTEIDRAQASGAVVACKLYPAGATTNSAGGVTDISRMTAVFAAMADAGMPLLLHGEVTEPEVDIFDRETFFIERTLARLIDRHPRLRIVLEHITTADAVRFVHSGPDSLAATITAHHLLASRNAMLAGGIRPHLYCLPILKRESDRQALLAAATSGSPRFFLGTDSAPHAIERKEAEFGCAGCFTAHAALELYAEAFDQVGSLAKLEAFASHFGPDFYGLSRNTDTVTLRRAPADTTVIAATFAFGDTVVRPYRAGTRLLWRLEARR